jgi:endonuclease YncB( thermonuclease family)
MRVFLGLSLAILWAPAAALSADHVLAGKVIRIVDGDTLSVLDESAELAKAEKKARSAKVGLWQANSEPVPPWDYRRPSPKETPATS